MTAHDVQTAATAPDAAAKQARRQTRHSQGDDAARRCAAVSRAEEPGSVCAAAVARFAHLDAATLVAIDASPAPGAIARSIIGPGGIST